MEKIEKITVYDRIQDHVFFRERINKIIDAVNKLQDRVDELEKQLQHLSRK
jgi:hypothetical protein